jgi:predicted transcriptional regulator
MSASAPLKKLIIYEFLEREPPEISRTQLMRKMYLHYTSPGEFDDIMTSLVDAGLISVGNRGSVTVYTMRDEYYRQIKAHLAGKETKE